jgi:hypothetical protein
MKIQGFWGSLLLLAQKFGAVFLLLQEIRRRFSTVAGNKEKSHAPQARANVSRREKGR